MQKAPLALLGFSPSLSFIFLNVQDGRKRRMCWTHSARRGNFGLWDGWHCLCRTYATEDILLAGGYFVGLGGTRLGGGGLHCWTRRTEIEH